YLQPVESWSRGEGGPTVKGIRLISEATSPNVTTSPKYNYPNLINRLRVVTLFLYVTGTSPERKNTMTLEQILDKYHDLATQATELRLVRKSIQEQLAQRGDPAWARRALYSLTCKTQL